MQNTRLLGVVSLSLLLASCSSVYERYLLQKTTPLVVEDSEASNDGLRKILFWTNYYRITIRASTVLASSQYAAGWYDRNAVDSLFGELSGPGKKVAVDQVHLIGHEKRVNGEKTTKQPGGSKKPAKAEKSDKQKETGGLKSAGEDLSHKKLVIFLSTNADSFVNRISSIATNARIQQDLVSLVLGPDHERLAERKLDIENDDRAAGVDADRLRLIIERLKKVKAAATLTTTAAGAAVAEALRVLAAASRKPEGSTQIQDVASAEKWRRNNPAAFFKRGQ